MSPDSGRLSGRVGCVARGGANGRDGRGLTLIEVIVVVVVIGVLIALLLPAVERPREAARRMACSNQMKQINLGLHNYTEANKVFPRGTVCATVPAQPANQYDVWGEAGSMEKGKQGTSFLHAIFPFMEADNFLIDWRFDGSVAGNAGSATKPGLAVRDLKSLYCPTRRSSLRPEDRTMMLAEWWPGGGTDYGGCAGRHAAFTLKTGYNLCDATMEYQPSFRPKLTIGTAEDTPEKRWGILGRVNVSTSVKEITDGLSNTVTIGELQRLTDISPSNKDGWTVGGPATLFTTGAMMRFDNGKPVNVADQSGKLLNNHFWGSPGSEHANGANFGMADGAVRYVSDGIDPSVFALMGSMADGQEITLD